MSAETLQEKGESCLTEAQKARIERNRLKALSLKAAKLVAKRPASGSGVKE